MSSEDCDDALIGNRTDEWKIYKRITSKAPTELRHDFESSEVPSSVVSTMDSPAIVTRVNIYSDWWMKRPKDIEVVIGSTVVATAEFPTTLDCCGENGDAACSCPDDGSNNGIFMLSIDIPSEYQTEASVVNKEKLDNDTVPTTHVETVTYTSRHRLLMCTC